MSTSLTWANYALIVILCLFIYYAIIAFVYRKVFYQLNTKRTDFQSFDPSKIPLESDKSSGQIKLNLFGEEVQDQTMKMATEEDNLITGAQEFAGEVEAYILSCRESVSKKDLIISLRKIIQKYPSLMRSESQYELRHLITIYCENYCSIHLSADELQALWND